jgi:hypothetical protein
MHTTKSLKKIISCFHKKKIQKNIYFSMHFGFNNQFIKVLRTKPIFQKTPKKYVVLF